MAVTAAQLRQRDNKRRSLAIPPDPDPLPPVSSVPAPVYVQAVRPTDVTAGSLWIPLNPDGTAKTIDQWQVLT